MDLQPLQKKQNLIFLTGYMGAGKSTVGRRLAFRLKYKFIDTDKALEKRFKLGMTEIFQKYGEGRFRQEEENLIESMSRRHHFVVSTGGGTLTRTETFFTAQRSGVIIYLHAPLEVLFERAIFSQKDRPLVNQPNAEDLFRQRFEAREAYYRRADYTVESAGRSAEDVVRDIMTWLNKDDSE